MPCMVQKIIPKIKDFNPKNITVKDRQIEFFKNR